MTRIEVSEAVAKRLGEQAAARGMSLAEFLESIAGNGPGGATNGRAEQTADRAEIERRLAAFDRLTASMREWGERNLPPGHVVDDSRESIYGGPEDRGS